MSPPPSQETMSQGTAGKGRTRSGTLPRTVDYDSQRNQVRLIDQRLLPHRLAVFRAGDHRQTAAAIADMVVRGAGAIGATAAFGLAQAAQEFGGSSRRNFRQHLSRAFRLLADARPTAVDPVNAMQGVAAAAERGRSVREAQDLALAAARSFAEEDVAHCVAIGRAGQPLIRPQMGILTHCNAGRLAFVDVGTATAPLYSAHAAGVPIHVFCDETRPRCQGATLTAWELAVAGIAHEIIADNAAGHLMQRGEIQLVVVGADRVLGRTGEVANKIGTYTKAVLAARHGIPFYVAIPLSTIDWKTPSGLRIPIEERSEDEVLGAWGLSAAGRRHYIRIANVTSRARNPGFDVTPPDLITGIITPVGVLRPDELWSRRRELGG
jgi:methylthioribose-1-phosphate isomerase